MTEEALSIVNFLEKNGLKSADRFALPGDASHRRYERISHKGQNFMLMVAPPEREDVKPFIKVDEILRKKGLNAPEIISQDIQNGLLLLEDFGDDLYSKIITKGVVKEPELYEYAINLLTQLPVNADLPEYSTDKLLQEVNLFTEWYATDANQQEYLEIWKNLLAKLDNSKKVLVLRDYHADNLIWLPKQKGFMKVGLLDFQDALMGHPAYDLVSLLEDARRDVDKAITTKVLKTKTADFVRDYFILGAQRNCKIIGIFNRLQKRDGKDSYLKFLPRVWDHLRGDLEYPVLADLKTWMERNIAA